MFFTWKSTAAPPIRTKTVLYNFNVIFFHFFFSSCNKVPQETRNKLNKDTSNNFSGSNMFNLCQFKPHLFEECHWMLANVYTVSMKFNVITKGYNVIML